MTSLVVLEKSNRVLSLVKELSHISCEILNDRQIIQRCNFQGNALHNLWYVSATCPTCNSIYSHSAGTAHSHTTGKAITQSRVQLALDVSHDIQNSLIGVAGY